MNSHEALPRAGLLGARGRSVSMGLMLVLAACGSSNSPADGGSGSVPLDPAERNAIVGDLQGASTVLAATSPVSALAARVGQAVLLSGTEVTPVDLAAPLKGGALGRTPMLSTGRSLAVAFQVNLLNYPGTPSTRLLSGVLTFQGTANLVLAAGTSPSSSIPPGQGILVSGGQVWAATAGTESAQFQSNTGPCQPTSPLPAFVTQCQLAQFTSAGFDITASAPASTGATGSRPASVPAQSMRGVSLTVDCTQGNVCGGNGATVPGAPGGVTAVAGNGQASVSWSAPSSDGGSAILGYTVTASPGGAKVIAGLATSALVTGLANGTAYTFTVHAKNAVGDGPESAPSSPVTPGQCVTPYKSFSLHASGAYAESGTPVVVVDPSDVSGDRPLIAWTEVLPSVATTYVSAWNGTAWQAIGPVITHSAISIGLAMALSKDPTPVPLVAHGDWRGTPAMGVAVVEKWDPGSGTWVALGPPLGPYFGGLDLGVDTSGRPVLAWVQGDLGHLSALQIVVSRYENGSWTPIGGATRDTTPIYDPVLALDSGNVYVAWDQGSPSTGYFPYARELPSMDLGNSPALAADHGFPQVSLAVDGATHEPVIAWSEFSSTGAGVAVHVQRWSSQGWSAVPVAGLPGPAPANRQHQLLYASHLTTPTFALAEVYFDPVTQFHGAAVYELQGATWTKVCDNVKDGLNPSQDAASVTSLAFTQDPNGDYLVATWVFESTGAPTGFVQKLSH